MPWYYQCHNSVTSASTIRQSESRRSWLPSSAHIIRTALRSSVTSRSISRLTPFFSCSHTHHSTFEEAQPLKSPPAIPSSISLNDCAKLRTCQPTGRYRQISIARQSESPPVTPSTSMTSRMESLRSSPNTSTLPLTTLLSRSTNIPTKILATTGDDIVTLHM